MQRQEQRGPTTLLARLILCCAPSLLPFAVVSDTPSVIYHEKLPLTSSPSRRYVFSGPAAEVGTNGKSIERQGVNVKSDGRRPDVVVAQRVVLSTSYYTVRSERAPLRDRLLFTKRAYYPTFIATRILS